MRYLYHLTLGTVLTLLWLSFAFSFDDCWGPGNTTEFWFGLFLILMGLGSRVARHTQRELQGRNPDLAEQLPVWWEICGPYVSELSLYYAGAFILNGFGGPDTVGIHGCGVATSWLLVILITLLIPLALVAPSVLGWKLAESRFPAYLPVLCAGSFCFATMPVAFALNEALLPLTFPLLPVAGVAIGTLLFLLICSLIHGGWGRSVRELHPAFGVACFLPGSLLVVCAILSFLAGVKIGLICLTVSSIVVVLSCSPVYTTCWLLTGKWYKLAMIVLCGLVGVAATHNLVWTIVLFEDCERARYPGLGMLPLLGFGGSMGLLAPAFTKEKRSPKPPHSTG